MKKVKGVPITGAKPNMTPKAPVLNDAKETSLDLEKRISGRAQQPFTNTGGAATAPTGAGAPGGVSTLEPRIKSGMQRTTPGARALPQGGPVGQNRPINQSGQMNGRMGTSFPKKHRPNGAGFPSRRNASFYGE